MGNGSCPHLELRQHREDLGVLREPPCIVLREDLPAVDDDVEDAAAPLDELGRDARLLLDRGRQTGGLRLVVSLHAVGDRDLHRLPLASGATSGRCPSS
jgi:hypothetical protein